jgi:hypothetical protein
MGYGRNVIVAGSAQVVLSIGGDMGTLTEIAFAIKLGIPVISLESWDIPELNVIKADSPEDVVKLISQFNG